MCDFIQMLSDSRLPSFLSPSQVSLLLPTFSGRLSSLLMFLHTVDGDNHLEATMEVC